MAFNVLTIDFLSEDAPKKLVKSLKNTGFAILKNHPIPLELLNEVYRDWEIFFNSNKKHNYPFHKDKQDGYFPFQSENASGYDKKDLKEFYHIYDWGRYPSEISDKTNQLIVEFKIMAKNILFEINLHSPLDIQNKFSIPLDTMIQKSAQNLLRVMYLLT